VTEIVFPGRFFQVWRYTVSHSQLQLRSTRSDDRQTRVDVLFMNVKAMRLATTFSSFQVSDALGDERASIVGEFGRELIHNERPFTIRAEGWDGWVIADAVTSHEDEGRYNDPSPLDPLEEALGRPKPDATG
jgi:hypothetical protein